MQRLSGYYGPSPDPRVAPLVGPAPLSASITLDFGLPARKGDGLKASVDAVSDPLSPRYRHYLTQGQFATEYGATAADYNQLVNWATSNGLVVDATYPNNLLLSVHGTVEKIEQALFVNLVLRQRFDGSSFVTVDREPSLGLTLPILWIGGLDDFVVPAHHLSTYGTFANPGFANSYAAADLRAAYLGVGSSCQSLTGQGQVIGIFAFENFNPTDIVTYDQLQTPPINPSNVLPPLVMAGGPIQLSGSGLEVWMDIEMAQAMAPNAQIQVFQNYIYSNLFNFGHADGTLHAMATYTPQLTVVTNSNDIGRDANEQQALYQLALQGVSFFDASGDSGAANDPQDFRDLDAITLVGGTFLNTNPIPVGGYTNSYYAGENTWNKVAFGVSPTGGATQGGTMNGTQNLAEEGLPVFPSYFNFGACECFPYPYCCGSPVPIPYYQSQVSWNGGPVGNLGQYRTYPDVSMAASSLGIYANGLAQPDGGTSGAAPLWAGFMALANELSVNRHAGLVGFANPVFYGLGITMGSSPDLYSASFNDIKDQVSNGRFGDPGYKSVAGYDMATGWGSPKCGLIQQLATPTPYADHRELHWLDFLITTGHDNLGPDSLGQAVVQFANGKSATLLLKQQGPQWNNGAMVPLRFYLNDYLCPTPSTCGPDDLPTPETGVQSVTISLLESGTSSTFADNWDISGLHVRMFTEPGGDIQEGCQFDLAGNTVLQDHHLGVVRLSSTVSTSGIGPQVTFAATGTPVPNFLVGRHCASSGAPLPPSGPPVQPGIQFIFSTGSDDLRKSSGLQATAFDAGNAVLKTWQLKNPNDAKWDNDTEQDLIESLPGGTVPDHIVLTLQQHGSGTDTWNINGVNIMTWQNGGPEVCFFSQQPSTFEDDTPIIKLQHSVTFRLSGPSCRGGL
jgi:Pro-kumamolisin, activation domain